MNPTLLNLFSTTSQTSAGNSLGKTSSLAAPGSSHASNLGDMLFGQLLTAQLQNAPAATPAGNAANSGPTAQSIAQLKTTITQMLQAGESAQQIAQQLAQSLGSNFLAQLQLAGLGSGQNMSAQLTQMLANALGPPGNGPPQQVASAMVQRFVQIANTLTKVGGNATGQQQDSLGTISDANAGDTPAPNNLAGILQSAIVALQSSAHSLSPNVSAAAAPPAPWVPTASSGSNAATLNAVAGMTAQSGGGPTVSMDPSLSLAGTGADTVIGRILARAANVAANQNPSAANAPGVPTGSTTSNAQSTAALQPQIAVTPASGGQSGVMNDALAASLLRTVQNALAMLPAPKPGSNDAIDSATSVTGATNGNLFANMAMTPTVNTTIGAAPPSVATPQSATPSAAVDPNAVVDQVLQGISMRTLSDGSQTVRMRLVPESLGSVTVNLSVQGSSVNATLLAQTTDVRDALLANQQALARSLSDAGLKLAGFTVNLANNGFSQQQQTAYQQSRFGTTRRFFGISSNADEPVSSVVPTYGPPSTQLAALQWLNALA